jgi:hypothetical protein
MAATLINLSMFAALAAVTVYALRAGWAIRRRRV